MTIKFIETDRVEPRQLKCSKCVYEDLTSCSDYPCYPQEREDGKTGYFKSNKE